MPSFTFRDIRRELRRQRKYLQRLGALQSAQALNVAIDELTAFCEAEAADDKVTWLTSLTYFDGYNLAQADLSWQEKVAAFIAKFDRIYGDGEFAAVVDKHCHDERYTTDDQRVAELIKDFWSDEQQVVVGCLTEVPAGYKWDIEPNACESYNVRVFNPYPEEEGPE